MKDEINDDNLDSLFTGSIDRMETEPSDKFWRRASEEILRRENGGYKRKVFVWRSVAALLASVIVMLSAYAFYVHSRMNSIEEKIAVIEKRQTINTNRYTNKRERETGSITGSATSSSMNGQQSTSIYSQNDKKSTHVINALSSNSVRNSTNKPAGTLAAVPGLSAITNKMVSSSGSNPNRALQNSDDVSTGLSEVPGEKSSGSTDAGKPPPDCTNTAIAGSIPLHGDSTVSYQTINKLSIRKEDDSSISVAANSSEPDTLLKPLKASKVKDSRTIKQRLYVSAFFSPKIEDDFLSGNDELSNTTSKDIKSREDNQFSFSTGLRVGYDISPHWSLFTGLYYHGSSFSVKPVLISAQQQGDGQVGYSIATSSGVVDFTDADLHPKVGDSLRASVQSSRNYVSIPFHLRYDFTTAHRLGFYLTGGVAINFAFNNTTEIHWENTMLQEGDIQIRTIPDLDNVQYTYAFAAGAKYLLARHFFFFFEPGFEGSFAAINKSAPIKAYPLSVGFTGGLTYHF